MIPAEEDSRRWSELKELADNEDLIGFYRKYAEYLEWNGIHSGRRQILYNMAIAAAELAEWEESDDVIRKERKGSKNGS